MANASNGKGKVSKMVGSLFDFVFPHKLVSNYSPLSLSLVFSTLIPLTAAFAFSVAEWSVQVTVKNMG